MVRIFRRHKNRPPQGAAPGGTQDAAAASAMPDLPPDTDTEALDEDEAAELAALMEASTRRTRGGVLGRLDGIFRRGSLDDDLWDELEEILIAADVGVRTATALIDRVRDTATAQRLREAALVRELLRVELIALLERPADRGTLWGADAEPPTPHVILVVGVNGAGKTTSIAKLAQAYRDEGRSVILGAGDTFRAAAIEQLQVWGERIGVPVIAHQAGADPGAVAYDTLGAAQARDTHVAIIDTAGRLQTKKNLMAELGKIRRVIAGRVEGAPHEVLLVLDATTGNNGLSQARLFGEATEVTGICLAKLDGTSKGGVVFAIAGELGLPVRFIGTGEKATDLAPFDATAFVAALLGAGSPRGA